MAWSGRPSRISTPAFWYDVLLDGPQKRRQLEDLKTILRTMGRVGIPILGYNFSIAGVWGWTKGPFGRGGAPSVGFDAEIIDAQKPIPAGMVWNMTYDPAAPPGRVPPISDDEIWQRLADFLDGARAGGGRERGPAGRASRRPAGRAAPRPPGW